MAGSSHAREFQRVVSDWGSQRWGRIKGSGLFLVLASASIEVGAGVSNGGAPSPPQSIAIPSPCTEAGARRIGRCRFVYSDLWRVPQWYKEEKE